MDAEFAKMLSLEEQQSLTEAKKKQDEIQRRDDIALSIVQEYPHIDYQTAYTILQEKNWRKEQAIAELKQAKEIMDMKEKREEQAIYTVF